MNKIVPFVRCTGDGSPVICLHSSAASSRQWEPLMRQLDAKYRVIAPDLYGHGKSPAWPGAAGPSLAEEAAFVASLFDTLPERAHLVGHSYGGAIALKLALMYPHRVRSVVLYEPVLFRLLLDRLPGHRSTAEIISVAAAVRRAVDAGRPDVAAQGFIDYWTEQSAWAGMDSAQQQTIAGRMGCVAGQFDAAFNDTTTMRQLALLELPMLYLSGAHSRASTRQITAMLRKTLPQALFRELPAMGHMGPVSHAREVNAVIESFLDAQPFPGTRQSATDFAPDVHLDSPMRAAAAQARDTA